MADLLAAPGGGFLNLYVQKLGFGGVEDGVEPVQEGGRCGLGFEHRAGALSHRGSPAREQLPGLMPAQRLEVVGLSWVGGVDGPTNFIMGWDGGHENSVECGGQHSRGLEYERVFFFGSRKGEGVPELADIWMIQHRVFILGLTLVVHGGDDFSTLIECEKRTP